MGTREPAIEQGILQHLNRRLARRVTERRAHAIRRQPTL
jgi:hypothetical protein